MITEALFSAIGIERVQMTYEIMGVAIEDTPEDLHHNSSFRCLGGNHALVYQYKIIVRRS